MKRLKMQYTRRNEVYPDKVEIDFPALRRAITDLIMELPRSPKSEDYIWDTIEELLSQFQTILELDSREESTERKWYLLDILGRKIQKLNSSLDKVECGGYVIDDIVMYCHKTDRSPNGISASGYDEERDEMVKVTRLETYQNHPNMLFRTDIGSVHFKDGIYESVTIFVYTQRPERIESMHDAAVEHWFRQHEDFYERQKQIITEGVEKYPAYKRVFGPELEVINDS